MQFMETFEANFKVNQNAIQNLKIQVGKLAKEEAKIPFLVTREENFEEVKAHEESLVKEHDSRERDEEKEEKETGVDYDYVADITAAQEAWDLGTTLD
ncbi:hypothetical protein JHK87_033751 [Glycine soja]|nr:hypothetical protein JHK87_033751 [Glycine soja]